MTASLRLLSLAALSGWLLSSASAQTVTWSGPAALNGDTHYPWSDPNNWSTNTVPNGAGTTVILHDGIIGDSVSPLLSAPALIETAAVELDGIRYESAGGSAATRIWSWLSVGSPFAPQALRLSGAGITVPVRAPNAPLIVLNIGATLEFAGSAAISGVPPLNGADAHTLQIRADNGSTLRFLDSSSAGFSELLIAQGARLEFSDNSHASDALIVAGGRQQPSPVLVRLQPPDPGQPDSLITFLGNASLDRALIRTGGRVEFHDDSTAATGVLQSNGETWFYDRSSAGHAVFSSGTGPVVFTDQSTAGTAYLYGGSSYEFRGQSTAGNSELRTPLLRFRDQSSAGTMNLLHADRVEVLDQADLSAARIINTVVFDISGALTPGGASPRVAGTGTAAGTAVADNRTDVHVRQLWNFSGNIYLGSNNLVVDGTYLDGRITDTGGAYRDANNRDFTGGGLVTSGFTRVSNPANSYAGGTLVQSGVLFLANGSLSSTSVNTGALLFGAGTVKGSLINAGTVNTDWGSNTVLTVQGDYRQTVFGNLQMRMSPASHGTLNINGNANLEGGILHFFGGDPFSQSGTINFFNAASRTGQWDAINLPGVASGFAAHVNYTATGAQLVIEQSLGNGGLRAATTSPGEQFIVRTPMGYRPDTEMRALFGVSDNAPIETLVAAVAAHDPSAYSLLPAGSRLSALSLQGVQRSLADGSGALPEQTFVLVNTVNQRRESLAPSGGLVSADGRAGGFVSSGFWRAGPVTAAALLAYEESRHTPSTGGLFRLNRVSPGLSLQVESDGSFLSLSGLYAYEDYDLARPIVFPGTALVARSNPRAGRFDAAALAGHAFRPGSWTITPQAGLLATRWTLHDFTESGVPTGAAVLQGWRDRALLAQAGVDCTTDFLDRRLVTRVSLHWWHELDDARQLGVHYTGAADSFTLPGLPADANLLQASLQAECRLGRRLSASLSAGFTRGAVARITSEFSGGLRWDF